MLQARLVTTLVLAAFSASVLADDYIPAQPVGWNDKKNADLNDQKDFTLLQGPVKKRDTQKVIFTTRDGQLKPDGSEKRTIYAHAIDRFDDNTEILKFDEPGGKPVKVGTYTVKAGQKIDFSLISTDDSGFPNNDAARYPRLFFNVPGKGLFSTEGGNKPINIFPESSKPETKVIAGTIRLSDFIFDNGAPNRDLQARLFFTGFSKKTGREPYVSAGTRKTSKILGDLAPDQESSDPDLYASVGPQNSTQTVFFHGTGVDGSKIFKVTTTLEGSFDTGNLVHNVTPFISLAGPAIAMLGTPNDLFYVAPAAAGGANELWRLGVDETVPTRLTTTGAEPRDLTFSTVDGSYAVLIFTMLQNGVRYFARHSDFTDVVEVTTTIDGDPSTSIDPFNLIDVGQYFYFAATYNDGVGRTYLNQYFAGDGATITVPMTGGGFPVNIREMAHTSAGSAGTLYFTADVANALGTIVETDVLLKAEANSTTPIADYVVTPGTKTSEPAHIKSARNLRGIVRNVTPGFFRLYFSAPINSTTNSEFLTGMSDDLGTKPFVTQDTF